MLRSIQISLLLFTLLVYKTGRAQPGLPRIMIKNEISGLPIGQVHVKEYVTGTLWITDQDGIAALSGINLPAQLHISHVAYEPEVIELDRSNEDLVIILLRP
ncbi:MAG: hypothetical protein M3R08_07095, partial [Bacteroidota bacterium]|nr:hypothetical protein [Bacteroidota bacterium]